MEEQISRVKRDLKDLVIPIGVILSEDRSEKEVERMSYYGDYIACHEGGCVSVDAKRLGYSSSFVQWRHWKACSVRCEFGLAGRCDGYDRIMEERFSGTPPLFRIRRFKWDD